MAEFSENRHISNLINMSCKVYKKRQPRKIHDRLIDFGESMINSMINLIIDDLLDNLRL